MSLFFACAPGLETELLTEATRLGFGAPTLVPGGVTAQGDLAEAARANRHLRVATRVLLRVAEFRAMHLAQLDKRAHKLDWAALLRPDQPVRVEATCRKSKIYHAGAAAQRVERAITDSIGAPLTKDTALVIKLRIEDDLCTISIDTTGEALHKRGHKQAVGKAPLRETVAAGFLMRLGFDGSQTLVDPMCGSGTLVIEAAEIAAGLVAGRGRGFAMDGLAQTLAAGAPLPAPRAVALRFYGSDRDQGVIAHAQQNAARAGVSDACQFERFALSDRACPPGPAGIVLTNPPWGLRVGERKPLFALYGALGQVMRERFAGWRVAIIAPDAGLVKATGLDLSPLGPSVDMGGVKLSLYTTP